MDRIIDREFDLVVTLFALPSDPRWYREYHLGVEVTDALLQHYSIAGTDSGYVLYVPRD